MNIAGIQLHGEMTGRRMARGHIQGHNREIMENGRSIHKCPCAVLTDPGKEDEKGTVKRLMRTLPQLIMNGPEYREWEYLMREG